MAKIKHGVSDLTTIHTHALCSPTLLSGHTVVYGIVSLLVVYLEVLHAAAVSISEIIARAPTLGINEHSVAYGMVSLLVVCREVLHAAAMLISEIIARGPTLRMNEQSVAYGIASPLVVYRED